MVLGVVETRERRRLRVFGRESGAAPLLDSIPLAPPRSLFFGTARILNNDGVGTTRAVQTVARPRRQLVRHRRIPISDDVDTSENEGSNRVLEGSSDALDYAYRGME